MNNEHHAIQYLVEKLYPNFNSKQKLKVEEGIKGILESKDLATFKGDISIYKQRAIDTAASLPRPVITRKGLEKEAGKKLNKVVDSTQNEMIALVNRLRSDDKQRKLTPTQFRLRMKAALKAAYRDAYNLGTEASGLGSVKQGLVTHTSASEKRWLDNVFNQEQKYFNKFLDALVKGESTKKAKIRIKNYANAIRSVYEGSRILQVPGKSIIHWVLQSGNPCPECRLLHRMSPYTKETLPTTPKGGSTRCLSYCYCKLRIVSAKPVEINKVARKNKSAQYLLKKLKHSRKTQ